MPDQNMVAIGSLNYVSESAKTAPHVLNIQGNVVFGSLRFVIKDSLKDSKDAPAAPSTADFEKNDEEE